MSRAMSSNSQTHLCSECIELKRMRASCFLTEKFRIVEEIQSELEMRLGTLAGHKTHKHAWPSGPRLSSVARPRAQFSHATRFPLLGKQRSEKSCQVHLVIKCKRNQLRGGIFRRERRGGCRRNGEGGRAMFGAVY